jgi:uncharacterized cofD-like protein
MRRVRITAIGGGTGLAHVLRGLAEHPAKPETTAIVAVSDDGGSSGRLRAALGVPAVGDVRACLSALARRREWARMLEYRFRTAPALEGHALGNLLLAAAYEAEGSMAAAVRRVSELVDVRGRVLPATNVPVTLVATLSTGRELRGESILASTHGSVARLRLWPELVPPAPGVLDAIAGADLVVLGPGSLFTSVIAAALPNGIAKAIEVARAPKVLVQNLTQERGETEGFDVPAHVAAVRAHLGERSVDVVLANAWSEIVPEQGLVTDPEALVAIGVRPVLVRVADGRLHVSERVAHELVKLAREERPVEPAEGAAG